MAITPLFARDIEIKIIDADLDLPLGGAIIRSWDGSQHVCNADGKAIIQVPDNRQAVIQVFYPGYETGRLIITLDSDSFILKLSLSGIIEGRELVIEAARPDGNETRTGRSIAISGEDLAQTAKIGAIEDTMASIKLLPGIIATEHFDASPSVRGGEPEDVSASLDGFYVSSPYFWGGAFSIFDPRMIESAQLSHGVFSGRYGHTISGLLDLTTKKPSSSDTELELGTDASALRINLSVPIKNKGGILFMGRVTYIEPIFYLGKAIINSPGIGEEAGEIKNLVNSINRAPFIRTQTVTGNYNFTDKLELAATAFFGVDGTGIKFENDSDIDGFDSYEKMFINYIYYQGFFKSALLWNLRNNMLLKIAAGSGFQNKVSEGEVQYDIYEKTFSKNFRDNYQSLSDIGLVDFDKDYDLSERAADSNSELVYNMQGRIDFDWDIGNNFLLSAGIQEMLKRKWISGNQNARIETWLKDSDDKEIIFNTMGIAFDDPNRSFMEENIVVSTPVLWDYKIAGNILFNTASYILTEYASPFGRFGAELGLRVDHYYLSGNNILTGTKPVLNPRLNLDFNVLRNRFIFDSIDLNAGTGLFSSMHDTILTVNDISELNGLKPARSWTSVAGTNFKFLSGMIFNIEGYFKSIYNRMYTPISYDLSGEMDYIHHFDGEGKVWGMDIILQKTRSRYWDGWISYSCNWTQHRDPEDGNEWYFPYYHRFHSLNLVLNVRPVRHINIYTRFGFASGVQLMKRTGTEPQSYPVYIYDSNTDSGYFIEKYYWPEIQDKNNRTTPSLHMDMKVSYFRINKNGKTRVEAYFALENILSLLYFSKGNTVFNPYTGEVATGRISASYGLPFPIPSFGFNYYY